MNPAIFFCVIFGVIIGFNIGIIISGILWKKILEDSRKSNKEIEEFYQELIKDVLSINR